MTKSRRMMGENRMAEQRLLPTRKLFDGSAAVRAPEVFKEYTAPPHCFTHVKQPTGCAAKLRPPWLWQELNDTFYAWLRRGIVVHTEVCEVVRCGRGKSQLHKTQRGKTRNDSHHLLPGIFLSDRSSQTGEEFLFANTSNWGPLSTLCLTLGLSTIWSILRRDCPVTTLTGFPLQLLLMDMHTYTYTEWIDAFHAPDVRRQTADWADRRGDVMGLRGLTLIWGSRRLVSPSNLISANCNPHQYLLFIIGELWLGTDGCHL